MCYLTQRLHHKCHHTITTQTHCPDESAPWHTIQYAAFSTIVREYDFCSECQTHNPNAPVNYSNTYTLPPSYRTQPVQSCQRPDLSVETYQDIIARKKLEAEAAKVQIHVYPTLDPLSPPKWLQQARSRHTMFDKVRQRRKDEAEELRKRLQNLPEHSHQATVLLKSQQQRNPKPWELNSQLSDSGYSSEASNKETKPIESVVADSAASPNLEDGSDPETEFLEANGSLGPVSVSRWAHQRQNTGAKLKERMQWERRRRQRDERLRR